VPPAELGAHVGFDGAARDEILVQAWEETLEDGEARRVDAVNVPPLGYALARLARVVETIALDDDDLREGVREDARGDQAGDAASENDGAL
jgi:hypothetical protein